METTFVSSCFVSKKINESGRVGNIARRVNLCFFKVLQNIFYKIRAERLLLVKCNNIEMVYANLQLGHLSIGSAKGG